VKEARLQTPEPTNRKYIRGNEGKASKHIIAKPTSNNPPAVDVPGLGRREMRLPEEVSTFTG
jgi:hypothetical protein